MLDQDYSFYGFSCTWCKYKCARKNDMQKHMLTLKHKKNVERVEQLGIMKINHTSRSSMFSENSSEKPDNSVVMKTSLQNNIGGHGEIKKQLQLYLPVVVQPIPVFVVRFINTYRLFASIAKSVKSI